MMNHLYKRKQLKQEIADKILKKEEVKKEQKDRDIPTNQNIVNREDSIIGIDQ